MQNQSGFKKPGQDYIITWSASNTIQHYIKLLFMRKNQVVPKAQPQLDSQKNLTQLQTIPSKDDQKALDPRLLNGPLAERGCTDFLCLLLFIANFGILWYLFSLIHNFISSIAYKDGKPERLVAAYDADGKACGLDQVGFPYLYFALPYTDYFNRTTCVKECPIYQTSSSKPTSLLCKTNKLVTSCQENCNLLTSLSDVKTFTGFVQGDLSFLSSYVCVFNSTVYFDRVCSPTLLLEVFKNSNSYTQYLNLDSISGYVSDLDRTKYAIYASFGVAFLLGILYLFLTRCLAGIIVWTSVFLYFIGLGFCAYWCHQQDLFYQTVKGDTSGKYTYEQQSKAIDNQMAFMYLTYIMYGIIGLSIIGLGCIFNKLRLAIAIIKTAAVFVKDEFLVILVPPVTALFVAALWFWWVYTALYVYALGEIKGTGSSPFATVTHTDVQSQYFWYFIFGGLWKNAFIQAVNNFVIASTCCFWYFSQNGMGGESHPIRRSLYIALRYHAGSLAFGALLLAVVQMIRIILEYVRYQTEKVAGSENKCTKCILRCLSCLMECFERFIRFLNNNAYIMVALTGKSFCFAAKQAFETIWANSMRFALVGGLGGLFIFIGKFCITITTTMIFYYIITTQSYFKDQLFSPVLPTLIVFIIAYAISVLFMTIYGMACDTVLLCFIYDEELNKQNGGQSAQHCPETLREFLELPEMAPLKQA